MKELFEQACKQGGDLDSTLTDKQKALFARVSASAEPYADRTEATMVTLFLPVGRMDDAERHGRFDGAIRYMREKETRAALLGENLFLSYNLHKNPALHLYNIVFFHLFKSRKM